MTELIDRRLRLLDAGSLQVLELASIINQHFLSADFLSQLFPGDERAFSTTLNKLLRQGWIIEAPNMPTSSYDFNHSLVRDVIYRSLSSYQKASLHKQVGLALENIIGDQDEHSSLLGNHFELGGDNSKALNYWLRAADRARRLYANNDAITCYRHALNISKRNTDFNNNKRTTRYLVPDWPGT